MTVSKSTDKPIAMLFGDPGVDNSRRSRARRLSRMHRRDRIFTKIIERTVKSPKPPTMGAVPLYARWWIKDTLGKDIPPAWIQLPKEWR
jgi:hypothetical protein